MKRLAALLVPLLTALAAALLPAAGPQKVRYDRRWVYCSYNLLVDKNADAVVALIGRAAKSGYNGMLLADYKFNILERLPERYFKNVARVRRAAAAAGVELIPAVCPIGYSGGLLAHDPNLAEGVPVKDAPFVVRGREAEPVPDPRARLRNGGLEQVRGDRFVGFSYQDDPGTATFADRTVAHRGKVSCRMENMAKVGNCRLIQRVAVRPYACYRLSAYLKTSGLKPAGSFRLLALGTKGEKPLTFFQGGVKPTQDWKKVEVVFNSLDQTEVSLYAGVWGGPAGTLWLDDLRLEELSLVNVLRRPGCPLVVASADGRTVYAEGKDYEPVRDPELGQVPWAGEYTFAHDGATVRLTKGSRIQGGQRLRVSWYHPVIVQGEQVTCCLSEPKVYAILRDQIRRVNDLLHPKTFFLSHDEIRVANWCKACRDRHETPGRLLADNVRRCVKLVREANPGAEVVVWSDMFDPYHNAVDDYYLVNGSLKGSWQGLPAGVVLANWNGGKAAQSLRWFAKLGHPQIIAGYYDEGIGNFRRWDAAAKGVRGVRGFMYTTWEQDYGDLERFGRALRGGG
jgi:hypothetical protein